MKRIEFYDADSTPWIESKPSPRRPKGGGTHRFHHQGGPDRPQFFEIRIDPNDAVDVHAHLEDEVIYVIGGEMHFGQHVLKPGASVSIPGNLLYSFRAGPQGLHYLNFRGRRDMTSFDKNQFATLQTLQGKPREEFISDHIRSLYGETAE